MLAWSVVALIISGASGETTRCAAGPEVDHAYCEDAQSGDSASLLQLKAMEHVHRESDVVAALHSASSTRRCGEGAYSAEVGDCSFSDWSDWGTCSKTCGSGERSRDRTVLSGTCDGACLKEEETCNSDECPDEACPPGTVRAWGSDCPDNGVNEVTTTPAPFCDENGMTASGKKCEGKIKTKIQTFGPTRACETASGDDCEGEFKRKIRTTYEDKDGVWVKFKREMSQDGGKTWKPLPLLLSELATFTHGAEVALPPSCCVPTPAPTTPSPTPAPTPPPDVTMKPAGHKVKVKGTVKNAKSNYAIAGATVQIESQGLTTTTSNSGEFTFDSVEVGEVVVAANHKDYTDAKVPATIEENMGDLSIKMVPPLAADQWEIVLTWEKQPEDLESNIVFGKCHLKPYPESDKECTDADSGMSGKIDIDNYLMPKSDKPETTTLKGVTGKVIFHVENYIRITQSNVVTCHDPVAPKCKPIADSKAKVQLYGPGITKTFKVPDGVLSDDGKYWYVFSLDAQSKTASACKNKDCN